MNATITMINRAAISDTPLELWICMTVNVPHWSKMCAIESYGHRSGERMLIAFRHAATGYMIHKIFATLRALYHKEMTNGMVCGYIIIIKVLL